MAHSQYLANLARSCASRYSGYEYPTSTALPEKANQRPAPFGFFVTKYDRSGRSTGTAFISFETPEEATIAKKTFDGKDAKGVCTFLCWLPYLTTSLKAKQ